MSSTGRADAAPPEVRTLLDLSGRAAIVTGASGGIGAVIAERFARAGAAVLLQHRGHGETAIATARALQADGLIAEAIASELASLADAEMLLATCCSRIGPPKIVVHAAGSYRSAKLTQLDLPAWRASAADNLDTAFLCVQAAAAGMPEGGCVVLVSSISAHSPAPAQAAYNTAKAGVLTLMRSAAQELGPQGIRVNSVSPGLIHRDGIETAWPDGVARWLAKAPLGRLGRADDIADACLFLASPAARWITGHDLVVDGGMLAAPAY